MTTADPETGARFDTEEMVDQVAIFFLAGHETSASALAWALYLLAAFPEVQDRAAEEAVSLPENPSFSDVSKLKFIRDVFRETLRLYPPVPMMVRQNLQPETFRDRAVKPGSQIVLSPWHQQRNPRLWSAPDAFDPDRWSTEEGRRLRPRGLHAVLRRPARLHRRGFRDGRGAADPCNAAAPPALRTPAGTGAAARWRI